MSTDQSSSTPLFSELGLAPPILKAVQEAGYETPSPIQAKSIAPLLEGRDLLGQAQTGTGKTAAFALPLLSRINPKAKSPQMLVLAPTRELAIQVAEAIQSYARYLKGLHVLPIYGGQSMGIQLRQLQRHPQVIVGTPGRVLDHIRRGTLKLGELQSLVLDEADEMLRMGFIDDVETILKETPAERQVALFSATMPAPIHRVSKRYLKNPVEIRIETKTSTVDTINQRYWQVTGTHKLDALTRILEVENFDAMIIFVRTKNATAELADKLEARGYSSSPLNGDMNQAAAVGTTVALLERGSRVMSAIHKRLYVGLKQEFKLLAEVFKTYLPPEYPYDVPGASRNVKVTDFDDKVDILPVADPNIFSQTQRISMAQTQLQLAQSNPQIHDLYQAYRSMYHAIGVKNINAILPQPAQPTPLDPSLEEIAAMAGTPFQAFPGQDHQAHIDSHLSFMRSNMVQNNPVVMGALQKNILERISLMAQEQIQMEFREEIQKAQQMQQAIQANPQNQQLIQEATQLTNTVNARKAVLIAEMTKDYMNEEEQLTGGLGGDPLIKLKAREVDLRAQENKRKEDEGQERINIDKMKAMMNQSQHEDKLEQNEDLAELRADTSLTKQIMADESKKHDFGRNFRKK